MNRRRWKISLIAFGAIVLLIFALLTDTSAQDLNMVVKKKDIHPKLQSSLWELRKNHEKGVKSFQTFAQSRKIIIENENKVTVYLFSEPGTNINETSLQAYGAEIIKRADNVLKARVHVNLLEVIADNVDGVSFIRFPDRVIPFAVESEGVGLTGASSYHSAGYIGSGVKVAVIDLGFAGLSSAISDNELPSNVVTIDCTDSGCVSTDFSSETEKHGTAVAEIVYDMAPGSQLYLIKIGNGRLDLRDAKDYCISNGIKIINFSVGSHSTSNFYSGECY
ncbi:MAG: S8 family serine peptidase, partial [Deltaproteobacteria bacterium]|nr:S8 family serine peptidase [Deltaproteobacteria bacterium]